MSSFPLRLLGPGLVGDSRGQPVALRSRKQLALLTYLAIEHQRAHSREALTTLLWPDEVAARAQNNLRVTLSRLRHLGGQIVAPGEATADLLLVSRATLQLSPAWIDRVDVNHFTMLIERTLRHRHAGRAQCDACQADLRAAVQLYTSELLAGFHLDDCAVLQEWLAMERERARVLLLDAYMDLAAYTEAHGDLLAARDFTQRQIELEPLRESAYRQQMRILGRQGERSAALACFERCRALLHNELGLDPEPETFALHAQILAGTGDARPDRWPVPATTTPLPSSVAVALRYLPQPLTLFVGRERELAELQQRLSDPVNRLLSLVGPGGIGKSRLALQLAAQVRHSFQDGACFVSLAQILAVESIPAAIAEALGLEFVTSHTGLFEQLVVMLGDRQLLLVLDNFEHLIAGAGLLVTLLQQAPRVTLVVTSRERLNLQAEDLFELEGLPTPADGTAVQAGEFAALHLFVDRAYRIDKRFAATAAQLPEIVRICQLVNGSPLAIELAASWARELSCTEIAAELTHGLAQLETMLRDVAPHHRSLRAVFTTSWRLLSDAERLALRQLAIFRGGFTVEAAGAVGDISAAVVRGLRDKSLLRQAGARRYDMHMLVQQFAAEMLAGDPQAKLQAGQRHSQFFLGLLVARAVALDTDEARTAADQIQPDWENVRIAWQYASATAEQRLLLAALDGLVRFCDLRGLFQEAQALLERSVAECEAAVASDASLRRMLACRLLTALAYFAERRGLLWALALSQQALALARQSDDRETIIANLVIQAHMAEQVADYSQARALATEGLHIAETEGLDFPAVLCLDSLGIVDLVSNNFARAKEQYQRVLAIYRRTRRCERYGRVALGRLGSIATELGRYDEALRYIEEYLVSSRRMDDQRSVPDALHDLAFLWVRLGNYTRVIALEAESITRSRAISDLELTSLSLHNKAYAHRALGELPEALSCAAESVALARQLDARLALAHALVQLAEAQVEAARQEYDWMEAAANFREAAASFRRFGKRVMAYQAEIGLAALLWRRGDIVAARVQVAALVSHLPTDAADGWDEPLRAYMVCMQILQAAGHPLAGSILDQGLRLLEALGENIGDASLRERFLQAVPAHRELRALHAASLD